MNEDQQLAEWNATRAESGLPPVTVEHMRNVLEALKLHAINKARAKLGAPELTLDEMRAKRAAGSSFTV